MPRKSSSSNNQSNKKNYENLISLKIKEINTNKLFPYIIGGELKKIESIAIEVKLKNLTNEELCILGNVGSLENYFQPNVDLGGNCGINFGRSKPKEVNKLVCLNPQNHIVDTIYYLDCFSYLGDLRLKYKSGVLDSYGNIVSNENDSLLSNLINIKN